MPNQFINPMSGSARGSLFRYNMAGSTPVFLLSESQVRLIAAARTEEEALTLQAQALLGFLSEKHLPLPERPHGMSPLAGFKSMIASRAIIVVANTKELLLTRSGDHLPMEHAAQTQFYSALQTIDRVSGKKLSDAEHEVLDRLQAALARPGQYGVTLS